LSGFLHQHEAFIGGTVAAGTIAAGTTAAGTTAAGTIASGTHLKTPSII
jgi:hypothetical protein